MSDNPQHEDDRLRQRALRALHRYFAHRRWPRLMMSGILLITGGVGFLASFTMLKAGMSAMWMRYPIAVLIAWGVLLALLRLWAAVERRCFPPDEDWSKVLQEEDPGFERQSTRDSRRSSGNWSDYWDIEIPSPDLGADEGCLPGFLLAIVIALFAAVLALAAGVVIGAPLLIAEVFLDAILVAALYKKVRGLAPRWWLTSALRKTAAPVLLTALLLMIGGAVFQSIDPQARSIGDVWRTVRTGDLPPEEPVQLEKE